MLKLLTMASLNLNIVVVYYAQKNQKSFSTSVSLIKPPTIFIPPIAELYKMIQEFNKKKNAIHKFKITKHGERAKKRVILPIADDRLNRSLLKAESKHNQKKAGRGYFPT